MVAHELHDESRIVRQISKSPSVPDAVAPGIEHQPVTEIRWVPRDLVQANSWNPNVVAPPELRLLKVSIMADGWTQPIVVQEKDDFFEIIDGFHRWMVSADAEVYALTGGYVPIVVVRSTNANHQMMSTVRHNRARGSHHVLRMADIVQDLYEKGTPPKVICDLLQMEEEEVTRFLDRGNMVKRGSAETFNAGWVPE